MKLTYYIRIYRDDELIGFRSYQTFNSDIDAVIKILREHLQNIVYTEATGPFDRWTVSDGTRHRRVAA